MIHNNENFIFDAGNILKYSKTVCQDHLISQIVFDTNTFISTKNGNELDMQTMKNDKGWPRKVIDYFEQQDNDSNKKIVLLLESPSNKEFEAQGKFGTTAPCWGTTGDNIRKQLLPIINKKNNFPLVKEVLNPGNYNSFDLLAVNAIRYQCDLGNPGGGNNTKNVFMNLWNQFGFGNDLEERLKIINPDLVINCCTKQISKAAKLTNFLKTFLGDKVLECSSHPCIWLNPNKIKLY